MEDHPVTKEVRALAGLNLEGLRVEWRRRYGEPPRLRSVDLLARMLSWRMQVEVFGGFDTATKKLLLRKTMPKTAPRLDPGMRLERDWRGPP